MILLYTILRHIATSFMVCSNIVKNIYIPKKYLSVSYKFGIMVLKNFNDQILYIVYSLRNIFLVLQELEYADIE